MIDRFAQTPGEERAPRGRPHVLDDAALEKLWQRRKEGATLQQCADELGVHKATIGRYITAKRRAKVEKLRAVRLSAKNPILV